MMNFQYKLNRVLELFLVILMSVLVIDVLWQVFSRYMLSSPSSFTDELAGFLLIWVGVLGAAYVSGRKEHLAIDILIQKSPPPPDNAGCKPLFIHWCLCLHFS